MTCSSTIRLLAIIEAVTVTGPARNLIEFCKCARAHAMAEAPLIETSIVTYCRSGWPEEGRARATTQAASPNPFISAVRAAGIEVIVIPERCRFDVRVIEQLRRVVERHSPDIVQTHNLKSHFLLRLSGLGRRYPWTVFHHGYTATDVKMHLYNQLDYWSLRKAARVITVSQAFVNQMKRRGVSPERIVVVHNSIHPDWSRVSGEEKRAVRTSLGIADDESMILTVGRLSREKGHADLVVALAYLRACHPQLKTKLVIVGDGPEKKRIEKVAAAHHVSEQIVFAGQVPRVAGHYAAADLFALPSHTEGSPNVLLEAMATGLPITATAVGGVPEIVTHNENALLVTPGDPQSMGEAMAQLIKNRPRALELAANARAIVFDQFSPDARLRALVKTYQQLREDRREMTEAALSEVAAK